ncbi:MAG: hypothetical protein ACLPWF_05555 [Bryobacteraceae bacterium]
MQWIDEMFVNMEKDRTAASVKRSEKAAKVARPERPKKPVPAILNAWTGLVSSIANDVNEFNNHKERAGQTPARISQRNFQCQVHLPGMQGKSLVLTLDDKDLQVSVHPEFPKQALTIAIELDGEGRHGFWVLGESTKESANKLSDQQLSEYLLKPILSSAAIN